MIISRAKIVYVFQSQCHNCVHSCDIQSIYKLKRAAGCMSVRIGVRIGVGPLWLRCGQIIYAPLRTAVRQINLVRFGQLLR